MVMMGVWYYGIPGISKGCTSQGIYMSKSRNLGDVLPWILTIAQGDAVGQVAKIGAVSGEKGLTRRKG